MSGKEGQDSGKLQVLPINKNFEEEAKQLILDGLAERFGYLDHSLNPDLDDIMTHYNKKGSVFLIAIVNKDLVATGAITKENDQLGRVERMSVKRNYRRKGVGKLMLQSLEWYAKTLGYNRLVLETNKGWTSALNFYSNHGFTVYRNDTRRSHFEKNIF
ncbi:GNAT family N-acetyltransferase [Thalassobacillus devorans]|uniref:GNAT family N-acetyltransferase n=1 Tax=Thalassobacillus devorans TaxID=279813 RepID=UPI00048DB63B|nr:GNAT family N-acetyltransferase [Thalassobacillus devorans]